MLRIVAFFLIAAVFGAALAFGAVAGRFSTGWIGAAALVCWALIARRRWERMRAEGSADPGGPERLVWHRFAGTGILFGHMLAALSMPDVDVHVGQGNTLAIDSWLILFAMLLSEAVFRADARDRDERDRAIALRGVNAGYGSLVAFLVVLMLYLGFASPPARAALTHWTLANMLSHLIVGSLLVMQFAQLLGYAPDRRARPSDRDAP